MATTLQSSASRRIESRRRELVLSLYLRRGDFWQAIRLLRERWEIVPTIGIPPIVEQTILDSRANMLTFLPPRWPSPLRFSPLTPSQWWRKPLGEMYLDKWGVSLFDGDEEGCRTAWRLDMKYLHELFVPPSCRVEGAFPEAAWAPFFSACILYDPSADLLLLYERVIPRVRYLSPDLGTHGDSGVGVHQSLTMESPSIISDRNSAVVWTTVRSYYDDVLEALRHFLHSEHGLDLQEILRKVVAAFPNLQRTPEVRMQDVPFIHSIAVTEDTTHDDVVNTLKMLKAALGTSTEGTRPLRDPLDCLQCAIWRDDYDWSYQQIGEWFNWKIQRPAGQKPRCETARKHVVEGRHIRQQR